MADIRRLFSVLSRLRGGAEAAPPRKVMPLPPQRPLALPGPPKVLALPAPKPKSRAKPRGGQFFPDAPLAARDAQAAGYKIENYTDRDGLDKYLVTRPDGSVVRQAGNPETARRLAEQDYKRSGASQYNKSPEAAARETRENADLDAALGNWEPEDYGVLNMGGGAPQAAPASQLGDWLEKTLAKYYKTDFGTEADPLRDLAARGLHYDPDMTPERWMDVANSSLMEDPIGYYTVPRHESNIRAELGAAPDDLGAQLGGLSYFGASDPIAQGALMQAAPWLRKQPVTDMLYGIRDPLDLGHFTDEMRNAMNAAESGLPADLAVRPEMLERMSFPQAVERVGRINQWRAKEMERAALAAQDNPVTHMFKEYPDDPRGMRWVEMAPPKGEGPANYDVEEELRKALKYEGDTMGHCVGGYCPSVMSGRSRIFSLRDAKGMPHVTIETKPGDQSDAYHSAIADLRDSPLWGDWLEHQRTADKRAGGGSLIEYMNSFRESKGLPRLDVGVPDNIKQIKGKQNRAPNPEYLPYVQDFVKSGQWGDIGDLGNTGLVRLPDKRLITRQQVEEVLSGLHPSYQISPDQISRIGQGDSWWTEVAPRFEGYARGGLAVKKCGCMQCGGLAVKRAA